MGVITLLGVKLLQFGSQALNVMMPLLTLVALLSSNICLLDMAFPFRGFVQVDTSIFDRTRRSISGVLVGMSKIEKATMCDRDDSTRLAVSGSSH